MKTVAWTVLSMIVLAALAGAAVVGFGLYNVSATDQHLRPTYMLLKVALHRSVKQNAEKIAVPELGTPAQLERGLAIYRAHCVQCHGAPGVAPEPFALGLLPLATPLQRTGRDESPEFIFWVVKRGIKMSAMPAFEFRLTDEDIWSTVAFVRELPKLTPREYQALKAGRHSHEEKPGGEPDPRRGKRALSQYACIACHEIPDQVGPEARLGPPLHGMGARETIGGILPNTPENMVLWLRHPQKVSPLTAMPPLGVTERDARDIAAYLATLK